MRILDPIETFLTIESDNEIITAKSAILFAFAVWASLVALSGTSAAIAWCADSTFHFSNSLGFANQDFFALWAYELPIASFLIVYAIVTGAQILNPPDPQWEI